MYSENFSGVYEWGGWGTQSLDVNICAPGRHLLKATQDQAFKRFAMSFS